MVSSTATCTVASSASQRLSAELAAARDDVRRQAGHVHADRVEVRSCASVSPKSVSASASAFAFAAVESAMCRMPRGPWYTAYIDAITARSTCAVQMFDVAFSRRMCCSRACRLSRYGGVARGILRHAHEAARQLALEALAHGHVAGVRAAEAHRHAEALRGADRDIRPELAGARSSAIASRSAATTTSAPCSFDAAMIR